MSKKLIAVASAAALALSALVAMPSVATPGTTGVGPFAIAIEGNEVTNQVNRNGGTAANAIRVFVPSGDVLRTSTFPRVGADALPTASSTLLRIDVQTPGTTDAVTLTATGGIEVITAAQFAAGTSTTATGVQALTVPAVNGDVAVYAYTTSTTAATLVVSAGGSSQTVHIQGVSPISTNQYKLAFTGSTSSAINGTITVTGTVRDMFDNLLTPTSTSLTASTLGGNLTGNAVISDFLVNATTSVVTFTLPAASTATQVAVSVQAVNPPAAITAFPGRSVTSFFTTNVVNLAAQITTLEAQITALNAQLAALTASTVTKAKYNKLVRKWNRANPNNKVARSL